MCDDRNDKAGPFLVKRRINGKLRTIGGCAPATAARRGLHSTLRFAAKGNGEPTQLSADQSEITEPNVAPAPPPGAGWLREQQEYTYVIRLQPCPNQGLDVGRC